MQAATQITPILADAKQAAAMLGMSRSHFLALCSSGRIGPMALTFGRSKRWSVDELKLWVQAGAVSREYWIKIQGDKE